VSASDKGTGKSKSITITNEVGRLSQDDIKRMIEEADYWAEEGMPLAFIALNKHLLTIALQIKRIANVSKHATASKTTLSASRTRSTMTMA
jgi:molecular chaperone DnaK (HSP70)